MEHVSLLVRRGPTAGCDSLKRLLSLVSAALLVASSSGCFFTKAPVQADAGRTDAGVDHFTDGGSKSDAGVNLLEACRALNLNRCAYFIRCGLLEDSPEGRDACVRELEVTWCGPSTWPPHVMAGALRFDAVKAETCATAFATWSCKEFGTLPDSCTSFLKPRATLGEPCYDGFTECSEGVCRGSSCPRTCQARAFADEPCTSDAECRTNLFCRPSPFSPSSGVCAAFGTTGDGCLSDGECLLGLHCVNQQCKVLPNAGEPCTAGACSETAYCDQSNTDGGVCVMRKGETAPCGGDECQPVLICDPIDQRCIRRELSSGDPCKPGQACPDGEVCLGGSIRTSGLCGRPLEQGGACLSHADCEAHLACLGGDGGATCQPRQSAGASCQDDRECFQSARCVEHVCTQLGLPTQACGDQLGCRWGLCRENGDAGVCGSLLGAGLSCMANEQCASGVCDNRVCIGRCLP